MTLRYLVLFFFLIHFNLLNAQDYSYRHYTVDNGLPDSETYHVFQDSKGYIWIATDNGVCRYDGYEFKHFTEENGLPDNTVFEIFEDFKGRIWFIPHSAKLSYWYNDTIYRYKYNEVLLSQMHEQTTPRKLSFYVDNKNNVYYGDKRNGGFVIDGKGLVNKISKRSYSNLLFSIDDRLIFDVWNVHSKSDVGLKIVNKDSTLYEVSRTIDSKRLVSDMLIGAKTDTSFIVSGDDLLMKISPNKLDYKTLDTEIIWLNTDVNRNLWLGTRNGAYCYNNLDINQQPNYHLLSGKQVSSVLRDYEGGYWFTTLNDGVYYLPNLNMKKVEQLQQKYISSIYVDSSEIWAGLDQKIIGIGNKAKTILLGKENVRINKIHLQKDRNKLWILSQYLYSYCENVLSKYKFSQEDGTFSKIAKPQPKDIAIDKHGGVWIATSTGLYKQGDRDVFTNLPNDNNIKINSISFDRTQENLYCGTNDGLWLYNIMDKTFTYLGNRSPLLSSQIDCIIKNDFHQNIWLGTKSKGIVVLDNDKVLNITQADGLTGNHITSFFKKDNEIWVGTNSGLNRVMLKNSNQVESYAIQNITKIDGLLSNEINDVFINDSIAYVAHKEGLNLIFYRELKPNLSPPKIHLKKIKILDRDTTIKPHYELPYYKNSVTIEFVGVAFRNNQNKKYKYLFQKRGERSSDWTELTENYVNLNFLPHGKYKFKVKAINENNIESIETAEVSFTIHPPFWKTWWFIGGVSALFLTIVYLLYKSRITELEKRNKIENRLLRDVNKFQQQALSQQMNPHFIFNTLNSIQYYIYNNDIDSSVGYLNTFSKLMRLILDNSQKETISIQNELNAIELYLELESLRLSNQLKYEIKVNDGLDTFRFQTYPLLLQPYVENAIVHGLIHKKGEKQLKIELTTNADAIVFTIEDNGIGRESAAAIKIQKDKIRESHGTNITGKRIDIINKLYNRNFKVNFIDLKDHHGSATGTRVIIEIPKIAKY